MTLTPLIAGELTLLQALDIAEQHGMHLVQHKRTGQYAIAPFVPEGWARPGLVLKPAGTSLAAQLRREALSCAA
jgi:hypothetical protein